MADIVIRRAGRGDLAAMAKLAGNLVRMHHAADRTRFLLVEKVEEGYAWWFSRELERAEAVLLVGSRSRGAAVEGYGYGTIEERDWNLLLDAHGAIHDIFVAEEARRCGMGRALVEGLVRALEDLGAPRVLLSTMVGNESAQRLFQKCGFRPTMLEMTRDRSR
jgi:ribosomal protein S18 acetylase RimI-like enzyme